MLSIRTLYAVFSLLLILVACNSPYLEMQEEANEIQSITHSSQLVFPAGTEVTITGNHFSAQLPDGYSIYDVGRRDFLHSLNGQIIWEEEPDGLVSYENGQFRHSKKGKVSRIEVEGGTRQLRDLHMTYSVSDHFSALKYFSPVFPLDNYQELEELQAYQPKPEELPDPSEVEEAVEEIIEKLYPNGIPAEDFATARVPEGYVMYHLYIGDRAGFIVAPAHSIPDGMYVLAPDHIFFSKQKNPVKGVLYVGN
ncbi:MAG: hypothetical protein AAGI38_01415 [Bacteroidota bacterium]